MRLDASTKIHKKCGRPIVAKRARKKEEPSFLSQEYFIRNHFDLVSFLVMAVLIGFLFQAGTRISKMFVMPQYPVMVDFGMGTEPHMLFKSGPMDMLSFAFYVLVWICIDGIIREYFLDRILRHLNLSKTHRSKFYESGHLFVFSAISLMHLAAVWISFGAPLDLTTMRSAANEPDHMSLIVKSFFICQISFWLHQFPMFYFQRFKRSDVVRCSAFSVVFLALASWGYVGGFRSMGMAVLAIVYAGQVVYHMSRLLNLTEMMPRLMDVSPIPKSKNNTLIDSDVTTNVSSSSSSKYETSNWFAIQNPTFRSTPGDNDNGSSSADSRKTKKKQTSSLSKPAVLATIFHNTPKKMLFTEEQTTPTN